MPNLLQDPLALEIFYRRYVPELTAYLARRCSEPQIVADVVSRTFIKSIDKSKTWRGNGSAKGWLLRIASHELADYFREQKRIAKSGRQFHHELELSDAESDRIDAIIKAERAAQATSSLQTLNDNERSALELVDIEGLSHTEAAQALGITKLNLRARLSRGRRHLRSVLSTANIRPISKDQS